MIRGLVLVATCLLVGCARAGSELDLTAYDQSQDQNKIADYYSQEAVRLRHMARDLNHRTLVYERLFGPGSDWVEGTRLLEQSYVDAAQDYERTAEQHRALGQEGASLSGCRTDTPISKAVCR
ncbi:MAG: hypothetical protein H8K05_03565 [Nitrospira sp.]|nr:hypothetical protein [Nitrospira sp.]MCS6316856.1 hypothetical protein [Nitrospira sp.]